MTQHKDWRREFMYKFVDANNHIQTGVTIKTGETEVVDVIEFISEVEQDAVRRCIEVVDRMIQKRKPTHGTCCTCQTCGGDIDDCDCLRNRHLDEVKGRLQALINNK